MKTILYCLFGLLCPLMKVYTQPVNLIVSPLSIGDTVPDLVWENVINSPTPTMRLSDFKGKLVIFDFWATWCTGCINALPKMIDMQKTLKDSIVFVLFNNLVGEAETKEWIGSFLRNWEISKKKPINLLLVNERPGIVNQLFPHNYLPHYVWIDGDRRVRAITTYKELTKINISLILSNPHSKLPLKEK